MKEIDKWFDPDYMTSMEFRWSFSWNVLANPSARYPVPKHYHYTFLKVVWKLGLVSPECISGVAGLFHE